MAITVSNVVEAVFSGCRETVTRALNQYDYGQVLTISGIELPEAYEVHFSNASIGSATTSIGNAVGVTIPDQYLTTGKDVHAWIYLHAGEEDGETLYHIRIPVIRRARAMDADPTPAQQSAINQAIAALNVAVIKTRNCVEDALTAEGWAKGTRWGTPVDESSPYYHTNATYMAGQAADSATAAAGSAGDASDSAGAAAGSARDASDSAGAASGSAAAAAADALEAEGWAKGTQNGSAVASGSPYYQDNSKYYKEQAASSATAAETAAASATAAYGTTLLAPTYSTSGTYAVGDYCIYNGNMYRCTTAIPSGESWTSGHWTQVAVGSEVGVLKSAINFVIDNETKGSIHLNGFYIESGIWHARSGYSCYVFPVYPGAKISINPNAYAARYTFFKSIDNVVDLETPDYATGYSGETTQGGNVFEVTAPNDANYIYIGENVNNYCLPVWVKCEEYNYILSVVENYNNTATNILKISTYPTDGYVDTNGNLVISGTWITTDYYPVETIRNIYLKAYQMPNTVAIASFYDSNKGFVYAIDTVSGTSGNGVKEGYLTLTSVPATAKYVRFTTNNSSHFVVVDYKITELALNNSKKIVDVETQINVLEPSASASDVGKFLKAKTVSGGKVTEYEFGEGGGGSSVTVDDTLSTSSTNPVQNKVITGALNVEQAKTDDTIAMSANLIDTNDADFLDGYFISGGAVWTNSDYNATGYILIKPGDKIIVSNDGDPALAEFLNVFTSKDLSTYVLQIKNVYSYTSSYNSNVYIRISYPKTNTKYQIQYGETITPYAPYGKYYVVGLPDLQHGARQRIDIVSNGDITAFDAEMQRALNIGNCDVYIHRGTYEFTNAFVETLFSRTSRCIPIGNGCRYYFETGAKITAKYTGDVNNYWHAFGVDPNVRGSFELHNLYLDAAHICYGIHDEYLGLRDHYRNVYDHCRIIVDNTGYTTSDYGQNKCIGGGLGGNAEIIIDGCYFDAVSDPTQDVSYHGQAGNNKGDNANIIVKNSWFRHTLALGGDNVASSTDEKQIIFCGNSVSSDVYFPSSDDEPKWTVTKWNNEIRT